MTRKLARPLMAALIAAALPLASACSKVEEGEDATSASGKQSEVSQTLAASLNDIDGLASVNQAIATAELGTVFDGPGSYTLLAPNDAAFEKLGDQGNAMLEEDQRPLLVAVLRDHILPGHLTPESIGKAIDDKGGPVTVTTLGGGNVTFSKEGDALTVANETGSVAPFAATATAATNGVIIPIGAVLMPPKEA